VSKYILALDQGTTSSRAILFDATGQICGIERQEFAQHYPRPGWVEHDPEDIWFSQVSVAVKLLHNRAVDPHDVAAIGITNQRETTILWERATGNPVANAIVWQDRRTAGDCANIRSSGAESLVRETTGLTLDPYFSATKICWLLDNTPGLRSRAERGEIAFGTVDSFLMWRLTGGAVHATDPSNASRTLLYSLTDGDWDSAMLNLFRVPREILPNILPSSHMCGSVITSVLGGEIPIGGVAGDQQAALFGQACHSSGMTKNTYGTGSFLLMNTGDQPRASNHGLITTVAWDLGEGNAQTSPDLVGGIPGAPPSPSIRQAAGEGTRNEDAALRTGRNSQITYALEGSVFVTGAAVQWLRDELQIIRTSAEVEPLAASVEDTGGVYFVPAFVGLGAPYWDPDARGALLGITRGTSKAHVARAVLEAACYQTCDVLDAMRADSKLQIPDLRVDGGMTANNTLLQMQADILGTPVVRPNVSEITALGAAYLAGLAVGFWKGSQHVGSLWRQDVCFEPQISPDQRAAMREGWNKAVARVRSNS
jgi:glycerol kinase